LKKPNQGLRLISRRIRLVLLNFAASNENDKKAILYRNDNPALNSVKMFLAERGKSGCKEHIEVKTRKLPSIIREFGLPFYCKIDVEGYTQSA